MAQDSVLRIVIDSRNAERNARNVANELQNIERNGDHASQSMDSMSVATRQLAGYMAGVVTVGAAIGKMDAYTGMQNRLKLVTESQEQLNTAMSDTFSIAQKTRSSWENVIQVYQRFQDNAKTLNIDMAKTAELTETVSKAVAISGASTQAAEAALTQFGQALASGVLRGEELNSILEQTPALAKAIAQGMGITVGQLRSVAAEGKITGEVLVDALTKSKKSVDELFAKTDVTIGQSLQLLSNEVTKFTGEAGKASGVATTLASSIQILANNLDAIAGIAVVGGVALLTKTILAQTVAIQSSISAVVARRAADTAAVQSQIQLTALEVQRTRQVAALALTEINLARQELNSATTRQARAAATMRLTQAEIAHSIALKQSAAAVATQTAAENALNASRSRGAMLLGLVGGPIGALTIGVTALAAGYMLLSNNSQESTKSLRENNGAVGDAIVKYRELNGIQRDAQMAAERQKLDELNEAYRKASTELMVYASNMGSMGEVVTESQVELSKLFAEYKKTGDLDKFNTSVQNSSKVSQDAKDKTANFAKAVFEAGSASKTQKEFIAQLSGELNSTANAGNNAAAGVRNLASALSEVNTKLSSDVFSAKLQNAFEKQGKSSQSAARWTEVYNENTKKGFKGVTVAQKKMLDELDAVDKQREARQKAAQASASASTKASKAALTQQKKDAKEANRIDEEQRNLREQYIYAYADREKQIELNLAKEIAEIHKAKFSDKDTKGLIGNAENQAALEKKLYVEQLKYELNEWQMTEQEKLDQKVYINELMIKSDRQMNDEFKDQALKSLMDRSNQELGYIKLAKETRIFQAEQAMYSEMELIQKRYAFELQEIAKVQDADERSRLLNAASFNKKESENDLTKSLTSDYMNVMGFEENPLIQQFEVLNKLRENDLINEEAYQNAKLQLQAKSTAGYMEGMLGGFASLVDENSKTYAVLFAAQKAFAVAQAMLNIPAAYSKAYDAVVGTPYIGPYIAPAVGAAAAALQVAQAASIKSTNMSGFKSGGYTGNIGVNQEAGVVHGQEYVLNAEATKRVGINTLNAINNGGTIQAEKQAQANAKASGGNSSNINLNPNFVIVDERESISDYLFSPDGTKAFVKFFKRNKAALGV